MGAEVSKWVRNGFKLRNNISVLLTFPQSFLIQMIYQPIVLQLRQFEVNQFACELPMK